MKQNLPISCEADRHIVPVTSEATIASLLEEFCKLQQSPDNLSEISKCLSQMEVLFKSVGTATSQERIVSSSLRAVPVVERLESIHAIGDIVLDCRRKASQIFRAAYGEHVRNLISSCRKRLVLPPDCRTID